MQAKTQTNDRCTLFNPACPRILFQERPQQNQNLTMTAFNDKRRISHHPTHMNCTQVAEICKPENHYPGGRADLTFYTLDELVSHADVSISHSSTKTYQRVNKSLQYRSRQVVNVVSQNYNLYGRI
jgi:hypothetical protein